MTPYYVNYLIYCVSVALAWWPAITLVTSYESWDRIRDQLSVGKIIFVLFLTFMPVFNTVIVFTSICLFVVENNLVQRFFSYCPFKVKK